MIDALTHVRRPFDDRADAGRILARSLRRYAGDADVVVLGVARGGVPVAQEVARDLAAPLSVVVSRKIGMPGIENVALGAIAEGRRRIVADDVAKYIGVPSRIVDRLATRAHVELERRVQMYRGGRSLSELRGRTVILVDDGATTGATLRAAVRAVRARRPRQVIAAVPVMASTSAPDMRDEFDGLVSVITSGDVEAIPSAYERYDPVTDNVVLQALGLPTRRVSPTVRAIGDHLEAALYDRDEGSSGHERTITIPVYGGAIAGELGLPGHVMCPDEMPRFGGVRGLVVLAHGAGTSRTSYRTRYLAGRLRLSGYATLRIDLLTRDEQAVHDGGPALPFDIDRVAARLETMSDWAAHEGVAGAHRMILIGTGSGAAASLVVAARRAGRINAVVAQGSRVDLAADALPHVYAPVLMIVGADDRDTLYRNAYTMRAFPGSASLIKVPRTGSAFDAPGALGAVGEHVVTWLDRVQSGSRSVLRWAGL